MNWKTWLPLTAIFTLLLGVASLQAQDAKKGEPKKGEPKKGKTETFKPIDINEALDANDPADPKHNKPAKRYTIKLQKDKTYIVDLVTKDFDAYLRLLNKKGDELAEDDDGGGDLNSRIIHSAKETEDHQIVVTTFDGEVGKFNLKVREFALKGEAKARPIGKDGFTITANIAQGDTTAISKLGRVYSVELKAGETYTINLDSPTMDSYLYLFDSKNKLHAQDDDSGGDVNSQITFRATADGVYHIIATSLDGTETGEFTLKVRKGE
jgi:Bacterial pre-peptidase C-terminal domain